MQEYAGDRDVFIRSMASRGHAGGLAPTSIAAASVLDAAGYDVVLMETVGTGQSEVEVAAAADTTVVLEAPESGDEVQAIKAGLLEVADIVVVNKADRPGAQRTASQLRAMLVASAPRSLSGGRPAPKRPQVLHHDSVDGRRSGGAARPRSTLALLIATGRVASDPARLARADAQVGQCSPSGCKPGLPARTSPARAETLVGTKSRSIVSTPIRLRTRCWPCVGAPPAGDSR